MVGIINFLYVLQRQRIYNQAYNVFRISFVFPWSRDFEESVVFLYAFKSIERQFVDELFFDKRNIFVV